MDRDEEAARRENVRRSYYQRFSDQGEESVRADLANRVLRGREARWAQDWISSLDDERESNREKRRDEISEETLSEARKANSIAERAIAKATMANTIAIIASIIAVAAIAVSIGTEVFSD
ncbi:MAG: hypothetical protein DI555_07050 [Novosphingobium pentaromativorans]|uniref:Uncharacterized protein n=1 Tax=Novosphingobium pentaromativorans TaxID=205844 RepID=A0A2W5QDX0_9SPHN|nr:MAG: hypothetical protein DI555_07050 [Novosphingobium pentaromativorans]